MMRLSKIINRIKWLIFKTKLAEVGLNSHVEEGFSIIGEECIYIGDNFSAGKGVKIHAFTKYNEKLLDKKPNIQIGDNVILTERSYISCANSIKIGDGVLMGENSFICDNFHGDTKDIQVDIPPVMRALSIGGEVNIGKNVWLGRNVCVMPGVFIGDGAIIGANAVVTKSIPAGAVAAGVPAKVIRD